ncbi:MAG: hypothetical protein IPI73_17110 [Betaproteobacteria bacterium]|nr:hypothetical protein [Betaproteobacteria bacterium]
MFNAAVSIVASRVFTSAGIVAPAAWAISKPSNAQPSVEPSALLLSFRS